MTSIFCILPPYILRQIAQNGNDHQREVALWTLGTDVERRAERALFTAKTSSKSGTTGKPGQPLRTISDCGHASSTATAKAVRVEGGAAVGDLEVDEAYDGLGATYDLYWKIFGRNSIDAKGLALKSFVHYGQKYDNAFWDGTEMIFGDGDGTTFNRFTIAVDVIGHELTHGVTQYESNLDYDGQPGALNESVSDVFGSLVKQYALGQSADEADWLIGAGLLVDKDDLALRSMKAPGTAYDDPLLGHDPQPDNMADYVDTDDDNGGVHTNSGIPNRAFALASIGIGGNAWESAGKVWYQTLTSGKLAKSTNFATFAKATVATASDLYGKSAKQTLTVHEAWVEVGVLD